MNRRSLLKGAVALPALAVFDIPRAALGIGDPLRRVRPGDPRWPSQADWDALERSLSGKLMKPSALLADCASDASSAPCKVTLANLHNPFFIGDQPSGTQVSGWFQA